MDYYNGDEEGCFSEHGGNRKCLEWENHHKNMVDSLFTALTTGSLTDVTLVSAEGRRIKAHQIILSVGSSYFQKVLEENRCTNTIIILKDIKFADLQAIVQYIYTGKLDVDADRIHEIKQNAASLQVKGLTESETLAYESKSTSPGERSDKSISSDECLSPILVPRTPTPPLSSATTAPVDSWAAANEYSEVIHDVPAREPRKAAMSIGEEVGFLQENTHFPSITTSVVDPYVGENETFAHNSTRNVKGREKSNPPFLITRRKKKEAWLDPDALSRSRSLNQNKTKRLTQTNLISLSLKMNQPKPKMDISKHKIFLGGARSSQPTASDSSTESNQNIDKKKVKAGTKRKSEESVEEENELETRSVDLSITHFESPSPKKGSPNDDVQFTQPTSPVQGTSKPKPRSPLSPGRMNIMETTPDNVPENIKRNIFRKDPQDSTLDLLKNYDKIPEFKTPTPKKINRNQEKAKQDRRELKCICGQTDLAQYVDKKELRRNCPVHGSEVEDKPLLPVDTPDHFWCTKQYTTQELYDEGRIIVGTPFTPPARRRRRRNSNETFIGTENIDLCDE